MKIAIFSSAYENPTDKLENLAQKMGKYLVKKNIHVLTGGCTGLPSVVAKVVSIEGGRVTAFYPDISARALAKNKDEHNNDLQDIYYEKKYFEGFTLRSIEMIKQADAAIVFNGRFGTLSEFTIAVEEGLQTAVLEGTGGVSDQVRSLCDLVERDLETGNILIGKDYEKVIDQLIAEHGKN